MAERTTHERIPYVDLARQNEPLRGELMDAVARVLDHGQFILGPEVTELERRLGSRLGVEHAIGVANGTDALVLALRACGIGSGDEVLTVSHSFVATALAVRLVGATPVFVDVEERSMLLDPALLEASLSARTRAVMPVHLNGLACDMGPIVAFCEGHGLQLIEDCAQALGATAGGRPVGSFGIGCFSLHPLKPLAACGDAGLVTTDDAELAERLRRLRNLGLVDRDHCEIVGTNSRLDTLQAALLLVKEPHLDRWIASRRDHARHYREALHGRLTLPAEEAPGDVATYSAFAVRHPRRDRLQELMAERGVDVKAHYPLAIHQQGAFADLAGPALPVTERVVDSILSLPVSPELRVDGRTRVIEAMLECLEAVDR
ncbi:MAG: DegT/DnrJ/EryC1/StrS family aminotransferase [Thermoanaerobaculia bacterium]